MTLVNVDDEIYKQVTMVVKKNGIEYPNIKNFVDRALKEKVRIEIIREKEAELPVTKKKR